MFKIFSKKLKYGTGLLFDEAENNDIPVKKIEGAARRAVDKQLADCPVVSLKQYAPRPGNQGETSTCAVWAAVYTAQTIMVSKRLNRHDNDITTRNALSPAFVYWNSFNQNPDWYAGLTIPRALRTIKEIGSPIMSEAEIKFGITGAPIAQYNKSRKYYIKDYYRVYSTEKEKISMIKSQIANDHVVIIALKVSESFKNAKEYWKTHDESPDNDYELHGVCIIGFDEKRKAFEIQNSWGEGWGNHGCTWVDYDTLAKYTLGAYLMEDNEDNYQIPAEYTGKVDIELSRRTWKKPCFELIENGFYKASAMNYEGGIKFRFSFNINLTLHCYILAAKNEMSEFLPVFPLGEESSIIPQKIDYMIPRKERWFNTETDGNIFLLLFSRSDKLSLDSIQIKLDGSKNCGKLTDRLSVSIGSNFISFYNVKYEPDMLGYCGYITRDSDIFGMIVSIGPVKNHNS
jgi:hypothetical protein